MEQLDKGIELVGGVFVVKSKRPLNDTTFPGSWGIARVNRAAREWRKSLVVEDGLLRGKQRRDGSCVYYGRAPLDLDRKEKTWRCASDDEARKQFAAWLTALRLQQTRGVSGDTVAEVFEAQLDARIEAGELAPQSRRVVEKAAARGLAEFGKRRVQEVTGDDLQAWVNGPLARYRKRDGGALSRTVAQRYVGVLMSVFKSAKQRRLIDAVPPEPVLPAGAFPVTQAGKDTLTFPEAQRVIHELKAIDYRKGVMAEVQFWLGLRAGEVNALRLNDFYVRDLGDGRQMVFCRIRCHFLENLKLAPGTKTGGRTGKHDQQRQGKGIPVPGSLWIAIQNYRKWLIEQGDQYIGEGSERSIPFGCDPSVAHCYVEGGWLFSGHGRSCNQWHPGIALQVYSRQLRQAFKAAGLPEMVNSTHALRKAFSDAMRERTEDELLVTKLMGQSSVSVNRAAYQTTTDAEHARIADAKEALANAMLSPTNQAAE